MSIGTIYYRFDEFGKIRKIWGEGEVVSIPDDLDDEARKKLWEPNQRWIFDDIIFDRCTFNFTQTYMFIGCSFRNCDMSGIDPTHAALTSETVGCINIRGSSCPPSGDFTGYKIAFDVWTGEPVLVTLRVPEQAERRGNGFDKKFRVSSAQVVNMRFADGAKCHRAYSGHSPYFLYGLNDIVEPAYGFFRGYTTCSSGIHMFLDPEDAIEYGRTWGPRMGNVPRYVAIERACFGLCSTPSIVESTQEIKKGIELQDGPCPYPERLEMKNKGDWSWVEAERKDR